MIRPSGKTLAEVALGAPPAAPAIFFGQEVISYGELHARAQAVARAMAGLGIGAGSRVGALFGNEPDWVVTALAASALGAVFVPLNTWYKAAELAWTLRHCGLSLLILRRQFLKSDYGQVLNELMPDVAIARPGALRSETFPELRTIVMTGEAVPGTMTWSDFLEGGRGVALPTGAVDPESTAYVLYTSGSTAEPKGVMLRHSGVVGNGFDLGQRRGMGPEDRTFLATPLFYALGATNALPATFTAGAAVVLQGSFEAGGAIELIRRTGATVYYGTGNTSRAIIDHPTFSRAAVATLKKGNAGLGAEYKRLTLVEMGITCAVPAYGLTETYGNATVGLPDDPLEVKLATDGRPLPGMEIIIVEPQTGRPLAQGEIGLVLIRGHTTPGYLDNPVETAKALRPDGFFDTGDLGSFDSEGRFVFHARLKEVIKTGGINVSPAEVEQLLVGHPDVRDAYVVGVADPARGELVVAFVNAAAPVSEAALQSYVKERAASFKTPHHILFRREEQLPRLATGKVAKHRLAAEARRELGL
ncbi:MAG TPA: class I adenylate-forming enzyme family protein, partial [Caulobacteraceae bacterium]|nr:class I adenylate-forming enzyme family protein [Caulobacteraceae bacterium]